MKILDFGIAKALGGDSADEGTKSGTLKGKFAYMAPEQTVSNDIDRRIDIFATGIVLHEILTGRRLFKGENDMQTIERVRRCEVTPPSLFNPLCPPQLDRIVLQALARDRDERYQSASEMADALDDVVYASRFQATHLAQTMRSLFPADLGADPRASMAGQSSRAMTGSVSPSRPSTVRTGPGSSRPNPTATRSPTVPPVVAPTPITCWLLPLDAEPVALGPRRPAAAAGLPQAAHGGRAGLGGHVGAAPARLRLRRRRHLHAAGNPDAGCPPDDPAARSGVRVEPHGRRRVRGRQQRVSRPHAFPTQGRVPHRPHNLRGVPFGRVPGNDQGGEAGVGGRRHPAARARARPGPATKVVTPPPAPPPAIAPTPVPPSPPSKGAAVERPKRHGKGKKGKGVAPANTDPFEAAAGKPGGSGRKSSPFD